MHHVHEVALRNLRGGRQAELPRDLGRADRRADLGEQPKRLAKFALPGGVVAAEAGQLRALDVEEGLVALRSRHLEPGVGFGERGLDFSRRRRPRLSRRARIRVSRAENSRNRAPRR